MQKSTVPMWNHRMKINCTLFAVFWADVHVCGYHELVLVYTREISLLPEFLEHGSLWLVHPPHLHGLIPRLL